MSYQAVVRPDAKAASEQMHTECSVKFFANKSASSLTDAFRLIARGLNLLSLLVEMGVAFLFLPLLRRHRPVQGRRILILGYFGLGDAVMFLPALRRLRHRFPDAAITVVTSPQTAASEIFSLSGGVTDFIFFEFKTAAFSERWRLNSALIRRGFDTALCLYTSPVAYFTRFLCFVPARIGHRVAWQNWWRPRPNFLFNYPAELSTDRSHETERYLKLLAAAGIDLPDASGSSDISGTPNIYLSVSSERIRQARGRLEAVGVEPNGLFIGLHPAVGASQPWRQWGIERLTAVAQKLLAGFPATILLFGSDGDAPLLRRLASELGHRAQALIPQETALPNASAIETTAAYLSLCRVLIGNDGGICHLATACRVPTVRVFGMSDYWGYRALDPVHRDLWKGLDCSPCIKLGNIQSGYNVLTCGHRNCLRLISVEEVYDAAAATLAPNAPDAPHP